MRDNKQSSVELFALALYEGGFLQGNGDEINDFLEHHKAMHKAEIMEARTNGMWYVKEKYGEVRTNKDYYDQTFK